MDTFLRERGLRLRGKYDRESSLRLAKRLLQLIEQQGPRAPQPREMKEEDHTAYDEEEPLDLSEEGEFFFWDSSWDSFVDALDSANMLNDSDFFQSFGTG